MFTSNINKKMIAEAANSVHVNFILAKQPEGIIINALHFTDPDRGLKF
jgi:hypothetical protein